MNSPQVQFCEEWFTARDIARAVGKDKKTVRREAHRQSWPARPNGNREEYQVPQEIADLIIAAPSAERPAFAVAVRFSDLAHDDEQREIVLRRERAVQLLKMELHNGKEIALETVAGTMRATYADFDCSARTLRRWFDRYEAHGIDGLVEQKRGRVGRKSYASEFSDNQMLVAAARAVGAGQWKRDKTTDRLNVAAAWRETVSDPTIQGDVRRFLHGARHSKSAYPKSFGKAIRQLVSPLGATMLQVGKKAARLDGPFTIADYSDGCAAHAVTADDMTANCYVWVEWPNERGFVLVRPQILAVLHIGSLCWLNARAVISARRLKDGQTSATSTYDTNDIFGLFGDTFDKIGIFADEYDQPDMTFVLEGGCWQGKQITGRKVLPDDEVRLGGLRSLGKNIRIVHTRTPMGKAVLEGAFHPFQALCDDVPGYCGRNERVDCPEQTKQNLAKVKSGMHPRGMFMHILEYNAHVQTAMHNMNTTRNDGKICAGMTPLEKWQSLNLKVTLFPDRLKWMYRSHFDVEQVTRNGWGFTQKIAGVNTRFQFDHPCLENYRGVRLLGFHNGSNADTDAVIYSIKNGKPDQLICVASRVTNPSRFGANADDLSAEATRKHLKVSLASDQAKALAPFLRRNVKLAELAPRAAAVGDKIARVERQAETKARQIKTVRQFEGGADGLLETNLRSNAVKSEETTDHPEMSSAHRAMDGSLDDGQGCASRAQEICNDDAPVDLSAESLLG